MAFLLVVFDGLRPDMMRAETTPNLLRFAAMGTRFAHARSVFPSETRVCSASVTTGCLPRRHGLVANRIIHPADPSRTVDTGARSRLLAMLQETGAPLLDAPGLGERLAAAGQQLAVFSSGTTGQSFVLNPLADALGQITLSAHGADGGSAEGARLLATLPPPPADGPGRAAWIADAWRTTHLPAPPAASILWLCEPDTSGHHAGLASPANLAALTAADAAFGRILDDWQAGPQRDALQIMVASDHGQATVTGLIDTAAAFAACPGFAPDATLVTGSSCGVFVPGGDAGRIAAIAAWLTTQDWAGCIFAADGAVPDDGVLPRSALLADHKRAAHVLFTLRASAEPSPLGLPGTTLYDGRLPIGGGTHGGLLPAEMHIVLMAAGSAIRPGHVSEFPAGLTDIAPTALALLGLPGAAEMDGRVLGEALLEGTAPTPSIAAETRAATSGPYSQRLLTTRLGSQTYIDGGWRV